MNNAGSEISAEGWTRFLANHPALILTVGYLVISLLGLSFEWALFRHCGINFFYYADVTDFLMGAFREPVTFLLSASALGVAWLTSLYSRFERRWLAAKGDDAGRITKVYRRYAMSAFTRVLPVVFFLGYSILFIWVHAEKRAMELQSGEGRFVAVRLADEDEVRHLQLLGTSSRFVFLYESSSRNTLVAPFENLAWIRSSQPGGSS